VAAVATGLCVWLISASTTAQRLACGGAVLVGTLLYAWARRGAGADVAPAPR
jgi:hypothetical protein